MKATIRDFKGAERVDLKLGGITLLIGDGGAGKSSTLQALTAVAVGEPIPIPGITKSKAGALLRRGTNKAFARIEDDDFTAEVRWPKGDYETTGRVPTISRIAAGLDSLLEVEPKKRGAILAPLLKSEATIVDLFNHLRDEGLRLGKDSTQAATDAEAAAMKVMGADAADIHDVALYRLITEHLWPRIQESGWDKAWSDARDKGIEMKGQWKQAAGGENYGSNKADSWLPPGWSEELAAESLQALEGAAAAAAEALERAIAGSAVAAAERDDLQAKANTVAALEAKEKEAIAAKTKAFDEFSALNVKPAPSVPSAGIPCPSCNAMLQVEGDLASYALKKAVPVSKEEIARAEQARRSHIGAVEAAKRRHTDLFDEAKRVHDELVVARQAAIKLAQIPAVEPGGNLDAAREAARIANERLRAFRAKHEADRLHRSIGINQVIIDALADTGLRRKKLIRVLSSFNDSILGALCAAANWRPVTVTPDMEVEYDGMPHPLLCKSEQYRVRFVMQVAMAQLDGSALVIIDDADALPMSARKGLLLMLKSCGIPTVVGMMVPGPDKTPDLEKAGLGVTYWMEDGVAESHQSAASRKKAAA